MKIFRFLKLHAALFAAAFTATGAEPSYFGIKLENAVPASQQSKVQEPSPVPAPKDIPEKVHSNSKADEKDPPMSVAGWQRLAVQKYPELKDPNSDFNHKFVEKVNDLKNSNPGYFANPQWPFLLAQILAEVIPCIPGIALDPLESVQPTPPAPESIAAKPLDFAPFDPLCSENVRLDSTGNSRLKIKGRHVDGDGIPTAERIWTKDIQITVSQIGRTKTSLTVETFWVYGGAGSESFVSAGSQKIERGEGSVTFSVPENSEAANVGGSAAAPKKLVGWLAMATSADRRTLGVAGSSEKYQTIAKSPRKLAELINKPR